MQTDKNTERSTFLSWNFLHGYFMSSIKIILGLTAIGFIGVAGIVAYVIMYELPANHCNYWKPGLSADEKIEIALKIASKARVHSFEFENPSGSKGRGVAPQVPIDDWRIILSEQPECCKLHQTVTYGSNRTFSQVPEGGLSKGFEGVVRLNYWGYYKDKFNQPVPAKVHAFYDFNKCD